MAREGGLIHGTKGASPIYYSVLTTVADVSAKELTSQHKSTPKIVEAPGVEGRGEESGFGGLRDVSEDGGAESAGLLAGPRSASGVSGGFVDVRCSDVVGGGGLPADAHVLAGAAHVRDGAESAATDSTEPREVEQLRARLRALEHVLEAVAALLEAEEIESAQTLLRGRAWRSSRRPT